MNRQRPSLVSSYRALVRELCEELISIDCDSARKEPYRMSLELLLKDAKKARLADPSLESKIRDKRREIEALKARVAEKKSQGPSPNGGPPSQELKKDHGQSLARYAGTIELNEDPLAYQNRIRGEWS